jgi:uncharacterized protein with ParB-like and HNH nuclease domain
MKDDFIYETKFEKNLDKVPSEKDDNYEDTANYEIISYGADFTLSVYFEKMKKGEIITPGFQRRYVWSIFQASSLIESFLLGLPVPGIFLAKDKKTGNLIVIDGQQRLVTCRSFREEKFPTKNEIFTLKGVKSNWEGKKYSDLSPTDRKRLDDSVLRATIIQQIRPDDQTSIYHIFKRLNTGGTALSNQEIRNCIYQGKLNDLLIELNTNKVWRFLLSSREVNHRRKDEELILRFFALYYNFSNYRKPMNEFLSIFMDLNQNPDAVKIDEMRNVFIETIKTIQINIGSRGFKPKGILNSAAFDSIMYTVAKYKNQLKENWGSCIEDLFKDPEFSYAINQGTTDSENISMRLKTAKKYLVQE